MTDSDTPSRCEHAQPNEKEAGENETAQIITSTASTNSSTTTTNTPIYPTLQPWQRRLLILSLCTTLFLGALDITIISTALPSIASSLDLTSREYAWAGSSYTFSTTACVPVWVKTSDIWGRKPTIMAAVTVFMVGSLVSALAFDSASFIAGRVVQGAGGGGSMVLVTVIIGDCFPLAERAKYYGVSVIAFALASALGPVLGGVFTDSIGWRWCFYINLPFDGIALAFLFFNLNLTIKKESITGLGGIDWLGFLLIIGGTICFLYGLETGSTGLNSWSSPTVILLIIFGVLIMGLFMIWEAKFARNPLIPIRIFETNTLVASFIVACLHAFVFISFDFFLPLYYQIVLGFRPLISGLTFFAFVIPLCLSTYLGGVFIGKTGNYIAVIFAGTSILTFGAGLLIDLGKELSWPRIICFEIIVGVGAGLLFQSPMISLQSHLRQEDIAAAMSAFTFLRNLFTSTSIVVGTVLIQNTLGSGSLTTEIDGGSAGDSKRNEYVVGLRNMRIFYTCVAAVTMLAACFIKPRVEKDNNVDDVEVQQVDGQGDGLQRKEDSSL